MTVIIKPVIQFGLADEIRDYVNINYFLNLFMVQKNVSKLRDMVVSYEHNIYISH